MSRIPRHKEIRVVIDPRISRPGEWPTSFQRDNDDRETEKRFERLAAEIRDEVNRHVHDIEFDARVTWDIVDACSHCGYEFSPSEKPKDTPACCDEAIAEWLTEHPSADVFETLGQPSANEMTAWMDKYMPSAVIPGETKR